MDSLKEDRWKTDRDQMIKFAEQQGATVVVLAANGDDQLQIYQIENLIIQKVDVLIIIPHSAKAVAPMIAKAHQAGIKVISYDRLITDPNVDLYVSFDNEQVGKLQAEAVINAGAKGMLAYVGGAPTDNNSVLLKKGAMSVLTPLVKSGQISIGYDQPTADWSPDLAYTNLKKFLSTGKNVQGVVAANDGTAGGVIRALAEVDLAGKVPVSGQDAELSALQRIVVGTQTATVYKSIYLLAEKTIEEAMLLANKKTPLTNSSVMVETDSVPAYFIEPVLVTKQNLDSTVIKDGFHTRAEVYQTK
jgi:D-xylose transport system substrate-binding protein